MRKILHLLFLSFAVGTAAATDTITQQIIYHPEDGGKVFLVWKPILHTVRDALAWTPETRESDSLLYTPMTLGEEGFRANLRLPKGTEFYYCFWVTENVAGDFRDYWDVRAGATVTGSPERPIVRNGTVEGEADEGLSMGDLGLLFLVGLILMYGLLWWLNRERNPQTTAPALRQVFALGIGLAAVHLVARAEILGLTPRGMWDNPADTLIMLLSAAGQDLLLVGGVVSLGWLALSSTRSASATRWVIGGFTVITLILALSSLVNVDTVAYMGNPFTYQWLYYSDFLTTRDSWSAIGEQASDGRASELLFFCLAVLLLSRIIVLGLRKVPGWGGVYSIGLFLYAGIVLSVALWLIRPPQAPAGWVDNAVGAFAGSFFSSDTPSAFSQQRLPADALPFSEVQHPVAVDPEIIAAAGRVKNLLFIVLESAGGVYFNTFGGPRGVGQPLEPFLDQSLSFTNVHAHAPSTNCSMVALLTGIYPKLSYASVTRELTTVDFPSLPSVLGDHGYRTSFFSSADQSWQSGLTYLQHRGFDVVQDYRDIYCEEQFRLDVASYQAGAGVDDACLQGAFGQWLDESPDRPFFSVLWTVQAHYPYYFAGQEYDYGVNDFSYNRYLNAVRHDTEVVGRVLEDLRQRGLDSTTLVVVTGDHGEAFGQHGHSGHGNTLYEEDLHVPLYFFNPLLFSGERNTGLGGSKDIPATALSVLGVEPPQEWQGRNLLATRSEEAFYFAPWTQLYFGYRKGQRKYIFNESKQSVEVYDLQSDPFEQDDISASVPQSALDSARLRVATWVQHQTQLYDSLQ